MTARCEAVATERQPKRRSQLQIASLKLVKIDIRELQIAESLNYSIAEDDQRLTCRPRGGTGRVTAAELLQLRSVAESCASEGDLALVPQHEQRGDHLLTDISDSLRVRGAAAFEGSL